MTSDSKNLRDGVLLSSISIVWTFFASSVSVAIGIVHSSLVLTAFGMTGLLDAVGSAALVLHFRHSLKHGHASEKFERVALVIVLTGLVLVAIFTSVQSVIKLVNGSHGETVVIGVIVAAMSSLVLLVLALAKQRVGSRIPSPALRADALLSATGSCLGVVAVAGALLAGAGMHWADPVAALVVATLALGVGFLLGYKELRPQLGK